MTLPICLSENSAMYCLPKLLMGFSEEWNFLSPTMTVLSFLTPLLRYSLHDLDGLIFIGAHNINSSILLYSNNKLLHQQFAILPSLSALRPVLGLEMRIDICGEASRKREKETPKDWAKIRNVLWETENEQTDEAGSCFVVVPRCIQPVVERASHWPVSNRRFITAPKHKACLFYRAPACCSFPKKGTAGTLGCSLAMFTLRPTAKSSATAGPALWSGDMNYSQHSFRWRTLF